MPPCFFRAYISAHLRQLALPEGVVARAGAVELGVRALLHNLAALHEHNLVGMHYRAEAVGNHCK